MTISDFDTVGRRFFLGFVRVHILHHAAEEPVYGLAMLQELRRHGYQLSPGTLYPLLHQMHAAGLLQQDVRTVNGKRRKYYRITPAGRRVLKRARTFIRELADEVLEAK